MPKVYLKNGKILNLSVIPLTGEYLIFSNEQFENFVNYLAQNIQSKSDLPISILCEEIHDSSIDFYRYLYLSNDKNGFLVEDGDEYNFYIKSNEIPDNMEFG